MARKQNARPTKEAPPPKDPSDEVEEEEEEEEAEEEAVEEPKKAAKSAGKTSRKTVAVAKPAEETPKKGAGKKAAGKRPSSKKVAPASDVEKPVRKSRTITQEDVTELFNDLVGILEKEITRVKELPEKGKGGTGIQYLRGVKKRVRVLQNSTARVMKQKQKVPRKNNNSGFLKPVLISKEMAGFTGWDRSKPTSRVDVTRFLCKYISENDLQNPKDRREIIADEKLTKLLKYDPKSDPKPLTYYSMQTYMKPHFERIESPVASAA